MAEVKRETRLRLGRGWYWLDKGLWAIKPNHGGVKVFYNEADGKSQFYAYMVERQFGGIYHSKTRFELGDFRSCVAAVNKMPKYMSKAK